MNTLVTTLKGEINNNNLPLFNKFILEFNSAEAASNVAVNAGAGFYKVEYTDGTQGSNGSFSGSQVQIQLGTKAGKLIIEDKYSLVYYANGNSSPRLGSLKMNDLSYRANLSEITFPRGCQGDISDVVKYATAKATVEINATLSPDITGVMNDAVEKCIDNGRTTGKVVFFNGDGIKIRNINGNTSSKQSGAYYYYVVTSATSYEVRLSSATGTILSKWKKENGLWVVDLT